MIERIARMRGKRVGVETGENSRDLGGSEEREIRKLANRQPQGRRAYCVVCIEEKVLSFSKTLSTSDLTFTYYFITQAFIY